MKYGTNVSMLAIAFLISEIRDGPSEIKWLLILKAHWIVLNTYSMGPSTG